MSPTQVQSNIFQLSHQDKMLAVRFLHTLTFVCVTGYNYNDISTLHVLSHSDFKLTTCSPDDMHKHHSLFHKCMTLGTLVQFGALTFSKIEPP